MAGANTPRDNSRAERLDRLAGTRTTDITGQAVTKGDLSDLVADDMGSLTRRVIAAKSAVLGSDVALATSGQWYSGPSVGLTPGTYLITAQSLHRNDAVAAASVIQVRLFDGTLPIAALQASVAATSGLCTPFSLVAPIVITKAKVVTLQMRSSVGDANIKMKATAPDAGAETVATRIHALRIGD